ncbi:MAG TPA: hypothetical protein VF754_06510 [Pyrinomonadaceae bacterium]
MATTTFSMLLSAFAFVNLRVAKFNLLAIFGVKTEYYSNKLLNKPEAAIPLSMMLVSRLRDVL